MSFKKHSGTGRAAIVAGLALTLALAGCAGTAATTTVDSATSEASTSASVTATTVNTASADGAIELIDTASVFSERDLDPSYDEVTATITLADGATTVDGSGVSVDGSTVTITEEGVYVVSGTLADGRIVVDAPEDAKVQIVLAGASVTSSGAAALYVKCADKVFLTLADGTANELAATGDAETLDENNVDGAVFSKDDLTINGSGALAVSGASGHGIVVKDDLACVSGDVTVTAAGHAIQAKDSVAFADGTWTLTGGTDAVHCSNDEDTTLGWIYVARGTITASAGSDGFDASGVLQIDGGSISVTAGDDGIHSEYDLAVNGGTILVEESYEALEGSAISITGGTVDLVASDDGINAAGEPDGSGEGTDADGTSWMNMMGGDGMDENDATASLTISGGTVTIDAGGDGLDSNGDLTITGGETYVSGPTQDGDGALDYAGEGTITGGVLVAAGSAGMAQNLGSNSTQGCALVSAAGSAGDAVTLTDASGNVLASYTPTKAYACVVVSAPGMAAGETYTLSCGSTSTELTLDSTVYSNVNSMGNMGGGQMGGNPGQMGGGQAPSGDGTAPEAPSGDGQMQPPTGDAPTAGQTTNG